MIPSHFTPSHFVTACLIFMKLWDKWEKKEFDNALFKSEVKNKKFKIVDRI